MELGFEIQMDNLSSNNSITFVFYVFWRTPRFDVLFRYKELLYFKILKIVT